MNNTEFYFIKVNREDFFRTKSDTINSKPIIVYLLRGLIVNDIDKVALVKPKELALKYNPYNGLPFKYIKETFELDILQVFNNPRELIDNMSQKTLKIFMERNGHLLKYVSNHRKNNKLCKIALCNYPEAIFDLEKPHSSLIKISLITWPNLALRMKNKQWILYAIKCIKNRMLKDKRALILLESELKVLEDKLNSLISTLTSS